MRVAQRRWGWGWRGGETRSGERGEGSEAVQGYGTSTSSEAVEEDVCTRVIERAVV